MYVYIYIILTWTTTILTEGGGEHPQSAMQDRKKVLKTFLYTSAVSIAGSLLEALQVIQSVCLVL